MVAYSFKRQFRQPIRARIKKQTIRGPRKRHARVGEEITLYTGMRTTRCELIGLAACVEVTPIRIGVAAQFIEVRGERWEWPRHRLMLHWLAQDDGFVSWQEMRAFWRREHPAMPDFTGVLIGWDHFRPPGALQDMPAAEHPGGADG